MPTEFISEAFEFFFVLLGVGLVIAAVATFFLCDIILPLLGLFFPSKEREFTDDELDV